MDLYSAGVWLLVASGALSFVSLFFVTAPYGRHGRAGWGPGVPARLAWFLMELPSPLCFALAYARGGSAGEALPLFFLGLYGAHYLQRTLVFPLLMRGAGKPMPLVTMALALGFNVVNGSLNGWAVSEAAARGPEWLGDPRLYLGVALFAAGMAINLHADAVLRGLRRPGEEGYRIPHGGLYRWVSCPNYLGEILEWLGWALATWSAAGWAFAFFTVANLAPRARANHRWYRERFPDYPDRRRALVPGLW